MLTPQIEPSVGDSFLVKVPRGDGSLGMGSTVLLGGQLYEKSIDGGPTVRKVDQVEIEIFGTFKIYSGGRCFTDDIYEILGKQKQKGVLMK